MQVLALFGSYDDDCSGALDYYEFLDKVLESDYQTEDGQAVTSCRPQTHRAGTTRSNTTCTGRW